MPTEDRTTYLDIERHLTDEELLDIGEQIAKLSEQKDEAVDAKNLENARWTAVIKDYDKQIKELILKFRNKKEWDNVECDIEYDYGAGKVRYFSVENHALVQSRDMSSDERQMKLVEISEQEQVHSDD